MVESSEHGPLQEGTANHSSLLALRTQTLLVIFILIINAYGNKYIKEILDVHKNVR